MNEYLYLICLAATGSSVQYNLLSITRAHQYIILKTLRKIILNANPKLAVSLQTYLVDRQQRVSSLEKFFKNKATVLGG